MTRVSETEILCQVTWLNRRRLPMAPAQNVPLPPELIDMNATANIITEAGQTVATRQQQAIQRLAQQIVSTMEAPW